MVFGLVSVFNFKNRTYVVPVAVLGANRTKPHHAHPYNLYTIFYEMCWVTSYTTITCQFLDIIDTLYVS